MTTTIRLLPMREATQFVPLGVLGYCLQRTGFLTPALAEIQLGMKTVKHEPTAKLVDLLVSILAGSRAISQVNTRIRPDVALARAWGRERFAAQATLARTLDAFGMPEVAQLRQGCEHLFRQESGVFQHDFDTRWLELDIDLTPLPISKHAEASTKGMLGEKTAMVGNSRGFMPPNIMKRSSRGSPPASRIVGPVTSRSCKPLSRRSSFRPPRRPALLSAVMQALEAMPMSILP